MKIPTVKFDASRVTETVKEDVKANIQSLPDIPHRCFEEIYAAALRSITTGRDLASLCNAIVQMNIDGMTKSRAGDISRLLNNKATALMQVERQKSTGIVNAIWLYSGAPCQINPKSPSSEDARQDETHKAANGKTFTVSEGMYLDGKYTWPGRETGCRCVSKPVIPGFS